MESQLATSRKLWLRQRIESKPSKQVKEADKAEVSSFYLTTRSFSSRPSEETKS
jgi:hypothetical protein